MSNPNYPELIASDAGDFRPMGIRNLSPGLVERGKIKIGQKGQTRTSGQGNQFQAPQKLDYFLVTSMERGQDNNFMQDQAVMSMLGSKPREIPIRLIYDDINLNFPSRYACYIGKTLWCTGDGQQARRANVDEQNKIAPGHHLVHCTCHRQDPAYTGRDKCKITGTLSAVIDGADVVGGVWKFRTTSYNSVVGILSSLAMIKRITGGRLAGIPLTLKLSPKAVTDPVKGSQQTIYVVSIEYRGSIQSLRAAGYEALKEDRDHGARIEHLEEDARALLSDRSDEMEAEADDIVEEFYPEQAAASTGVNSTGSVIDTEEAPSGNKARSFQSYAQDSHQDDAGSDEPANDNEESGQAEAEKSAPEPEAEPEPEKEAKAKPARKTPAKKATGKQQDKPAASSKPAAKTDLF